MKRKLVWFVAAMALWPVRYSFISGQGKPAGMRNRNIVIFVFDGLRAGSVNAVDSPTMFWIRDHGVNFVNSHSLFPTFTTANASAIATGHYLGDTGDFSNTIYTGWPVPSAGGTVTPFVENDAVLGDLDAHFGGNYLDEVSVLRLAHEKGYSTA